MSISIYLVLLIVLLIFNLVFWLLVIWFRILFDCDFGKCCSRRPDDREEPTGHGNQGFVDHEDMFSRPSTIAAQMEAPPTYEEALKYDQFGFPIHTTSLSSPLTSPAASSRSNNVPLAEDSSSSSGEAPLQLPQSPPPPVPETTTRSRSSTTSSACPLSPIREEEFDDDVMPVTVVIDCIGVQASRLMSNCDTKVDIAGGESLHEHSRC